MTNTLLRTTALTVGLIALVVSLAACVATPPPDSGRAPSAVTVPLGEPAATPQSDDTQRPAGWGEESHGNKVDPNYDIAFAIDAVNTLTITFTPDDWAAMQADMEEIYGEERDRTKALAEMTDEEKAAYLQSLAADRPVAEVTRRSPMWVPATITFQDRDWTHVGVRYKGASSLTPWMAGDLHLPFKFDFDQFEDDYPEIDNQRFFGFKELSLANNYRDPAGMRDMVVYELLAEAGLPSLRTAPYEIALDHGQGPVRLGLYTIVEVVDDTGIPGYFGSDDGNLYEGEGPGASLSNQIAQLVEDGFEKKNNEDKEDWSDIWALYDALHSETRTGDPAGWRSGLEAVFGVDGFLEWLGIAAVVGHGDTYGVAPHNFYLYNNPDTGRLTWFSWDHNLTFREDVRRLVTLDRSRVSDAWPLIRYLLDDPVYWDRYGKLLAENWATVLAPEAMMARIRTHAEVIKPVATRDMSVQEYDAAVQELVDYVVVRAEEVEAFLAAHQ